jgi:hypothetical protein
MIVIKTKDNILNFNILEGVVPCWYSNNDIIKTENKPNIVHKNRIGMPNCAEP